MRLLPPEPHVGDKVSAELVRELIRCIRERQLIKGPNYALSTGPNGTVLKIDVPRPAGGASLVDRGCWKIVGGTREEEDEEENEETEGETEGEEGETVTTPVRKFANQFYMDGECNMAELELDDAVEDFVCQGELGEDEEYTESDRPFVCLRVPATTDSTEDPSLVGYKTIEELQTAQKDPAYVVRALYKFTHDGEVAVDFRNCPALQVAEVLP